MAKLRKQNGCIETTRTVYKAVKKYDHAQFNQFCTELYMEGYTDGEAAVRGVDAEEVIEAIKTIPGIGNKRIQAIRAALDGVFNDADTKTNRSEG